MTLTYDLSTDYKTAFMADVSALISAVIMPREARVLAVQTLIDAYVRDIGKSPDSAQLERLADALIYEELTDSDTYKVAHNEYPILSDMQMERRHNREVSLWVAEALGTDGVDHRPKKRRMRSKHEHAFMDRSVKAMNRERVQRYKQETSPGDLVRYNLRDVGGELAESFVDCVGISERMRAMAERTEVSV